MNQLLFPCLVALLKSIVATFAEDGHVRCLHELQLPKSQPDEL